MDMTEANCHWKKNNQMKYWKVRIKCDIANSSHCCEPQCVSKSNGNEIRHLQLGDTQCFSRLPNPSCSLSLLYAIVHASVLLRLLYYSAQYLSLWFTSNYVKLVTIREKNWNNFFFVVWFVFPGSFSRSSSIVFLSANANILQLCVLLSLSTQREHFTMPFIHTKCKCTQWAEWWSKIIFRNHRFDTSHLSWIFCSMIDHNTACNNSLNKRWKEFEKMN